MEHSSKYYLCRDMEQGAVYYLCRDMDNCFPVLVQETVGILCLRNWVSFRCNIGGISIIVCRWINSLIPEYCILFIICYIQFSLFSVFVPICVALMPLFGIYSDRFQCRINISCCKMFTIDTDSVNNEHFTLVNNTEYTVSNCLFLSNDTKYNYDIRNAFQLWSWKTWFPYYYHHSN